MIDLIAVFILGLLYVANGVSAVIDSSTDTISKYFLLLALIIILMRPIGKAGIFKKAGESWWKAFIPFYNDYIQCKITGINVLWSLLLPSLIFLSNIIENLNFDYSETVGGFWILAIIIFIIAKMMYTVESFNKPMWWGFFMIMFPGLSYCILGFGKSKYIKPGTNEENNADANLIENE